MLLLFPLHPGPLNIVRVLANAGLMDVTSMKTKRRATPKVSCKQVGSIVREEPRVEARVGKTDGDMCVPLPFHVTSGQLAIGQGVVLHGIKVLISISLIQADNWQGFESSESQIFYFI
ncbi:unnamed protein product [Spirodela intermedia]|uniref:Uncharacterized protein n=1 Tax=Spirodela intermedia TaxID=51605 RepID=A0A7I8IJL6_SPIIN|nr:unnamed protein product [Spirodela intermedia]CAA6658079.1 unnamed protein product [Spirodela intermedia]